MSLQTVDLDSLFLEMLEETNYSKRTKTMLLSVYKNVRERLIEVLEVPEPKRKEELTKKIIEAGYSWGTVRKVLPFFSRFLSFLVSRYTNPNTPLFCGD